VADKTKRLEIPFTGPTYQNKSLFSAAQRCVNFFLRPYPDFNPANKGELKYMLVGTPGLVQLADLGNDGPVRGSLAYNGFLYVVSGSTLFRVDQYWAVTTLGAVEGGTLPVGMATNGVDVVVVCSTKGYSYILATGVFAQITDADFPGGNSIAYIDGYYLVNEPESQRVWRSEFNDGTTWESLQFSSAGADPDLLVAVFADHGDLWLFGENTSEPWYNTGGSGFNFARISGAKVEMGTPSIFAHTAINNSIYLLGQDKNGHGQVLQILGRQPTVVSTLPIDYFINQEELGEASMMAYQQEGHAFVVLHLPTRTLVFDSVVGQWHERSSRVGGVDGRWRANTHSFFNGVNVVGDLHDGIIYSLDPDVYTEGDEPIISYRISQTLRYLQSRVTYWGIQILFQPAVGLVSGQGSDPVALLSWSDDGGATWSNEYDVSLGKIGETLNRACWTNLGQGINRVFKVQVSDPVYRVILGAMADVEVDK